MMLSKNHTAKMCVRYNMVRRPTSTRDDLGNKLSLVAPVVTPGDNPRKQISPSRNLRNHLSPGGYLRNQ